MAEKSEYFPVIVVTNTNCRTRLNHSLRRTDAPKFLSKSGSKAAKSRSVSFTSKAILLDMSGLLRFATFIRISPTAIILNLYRGLGCVCCHLTQGEQSFRLWPHGAGERQSQFVRQ